MPFDRSQIVGWRERMRNLLLSQRTPNSHVRDAVVNCSVLVSVCMHATRLNSLLSSGHGSLYASRSQYELR